MKRKIIMKTTHLFLAILLLSALNFSAQIKVWSGAKSVIGSTSSTSVNGIQLQVVGKTVFTSGTGSSTSSPYIRGSNAVSSAGLPDYTWLGDTTSGIFHPGTGILGFSNSGNEKMRLHSNGYFGIGTTNPLETFQIGDRFTFHNGGSKYIGYNSYYDGGSASNKRLVADYASIIAMSAGEINMQTAASGGAGSAITFTNVSNSE